MNFQENMINSTPSELSNLSTNKPPIKKIIFKRKIILPIILTLILCTALISSYVLSTRNQDLQSDASIGERRMYERQIGNVSINFATEELMGVLTNLGITNLKCLPAVLPTTRRNAV